MSPVPPLGARRLDLVGDGTRLIQLPLGPQAARSDPAAPPTTGPVAVPPGERLLVLEAERILASGDATGPAQPLAIEPPREIQLRLTLTPDQLAAILRHSAEEK